MRSNRPIMAGDIVMIMHPQMLGKTGVVNRTDGENINVFVTQNNPSGISVWFQLDNLKRIGRVR